MLIYSKTHLDLFFGAGSSAATIAYEGLSAGKGLLEDCPVQHAPRQKRP
jgi:hypothetical protein